MASVGFGASVEAELRARSRRWLVTGAAGFIGSHLLQALLERGQQVVALDNFATGHRSNLDEVRDAVGAAAWASCEFIEGDIREQATCRRSCTGVNFVLHQAALGSVPRSLADPLSTHAANATGFLNMLVAARDAGVARFVYAGSSSTYGDHPDLPKVEDRIGRPLSPYAVTKYLNELYAEVFALSYGIETIGLRYFNVFGPRQDPEGPYAAVIPTWAREMLAGQACSINGDGETSRDFCYVTNAVQANLLAALVKNPEALNTVFNVAVGERTSLIQLHQLLGSALQSVRPDLRIQAPRLGPFRAGDVRHSLADIDRAKGLLGYFPAVSVAAGLVAAAPWYARRFAAHRDTSVVSRAAS
jgi:UDP-N-acetylglucosamine 4-epimerase